MGFLDGLEKLINEHGSAAILKERIVFLNEQHAFIEKQTIDLKEQVSTLTIENKSLKFDNQQLREKIKTFELVHGDNPKNYVCDHCGSKNLKRTGSKPDPIFSDLGIKQAIFNCLECQKQSAFTQEP